MLAIDESKLYSLIEIFKEGFKENFLEEKYKWEAVKHFQDNWNIDADDFPTMLSNALSKTGNLLAALNFFPRRMIKQYATRFTKEVKGLFEELFNESSDLKERIDAFIAGIEYIHKQWDGNGTLNHYQTFNAVSTYLWLRYPDKYYIYKPSVAKLMFEKLGVDMKLTPLRANAVIKTYELYDYISKTLCKDNEFKKMLVESLADTCYSDEFMVTAAIDLGYYFKKQQKASATTLSPNPTLETKYWMYAPGENASKWSRCKEQSIICIGWDEMGDLSQINTLSECRDGLRDVYENPDSSFMNDGLAIWEFSHVMQNGDIIYAKRGLSNIIARGIVKSEYIYDQSQEDFCHTRKVEWTHIGEWTLENIVQKTLTDITKYPDYVKKIETMITEGKNDNKQSTQYDEKYSYYINLLLKNKNLILNGAPGTGKTYLAKQIAAQIIFDGNVPEDFEENEKFINQYGFVQFHPSYDYTDFVEGLRPTSPNKNGNIGFERKDGIFKAFCRNAISTSSSQIVSTFQSIYDSIVKDIEVGAITSYQNRQGQNCPLRVNDKGRIEYRASENSPRTEKEENIKLFYDYFIKNNIYDISSYERDDYWNLIAELSNGSTNTVDYIEYGWILQELLNRTHKVFKESITEIKPYIFIIDEVNRGEISKIFGELFFAIDPGYRGKKGKVQTQYQNLITDESDPFKDGFYIPENVYIIGTMNDIDRSVECMDFAMRRRFTFKEITAEESAKNMGVDPDRMKHLNNAISGIEGFNSSFHIGAAYFRGVTDYEELWELKLQGLLKEYLRGMPDAEETLNTLKKAYFKTEE